eukprot:TRINITY_DN14119_c0_g1_i1.p1 TRINITY_DN14119_c0_g1~~TRINITY_DN14119_c0_g1_i1.p1  ORF type:complete len:662 (-),score=68.77 TRINITY_DN14119_c0_g1_i1:259-2244(-)
MQTWCWRAARTVFEASSQRYGFSSLPSRSRTDEDADEGGAEDGSLFPPVASLRNCLKASNRAYFALLTDVNKIIIHTLPKELCVIDQCITDEAVSVEFPTSDTLEAHALTADGNFLLVAQGRVLSVFDIQQRSPTLIASINLHYSACDLTVGPVGQDKDSYYIALSGAGGAFSYKLFKPQESEDKWKLMEVSVLHESHNICSVAFSEDGASLAVAALDGHLAIWNIQKASSISEAEAFYDFFKKERVTCLTFARTKPLLAIGFWDGSILIYSQSLESSDQWTQMASWPPIDAASSSSKIGGQPGTFICWSPNERFLVHTFAQVVSITEVHTGITLASLKVPSLLGSIKGLSNFPTYGLFAFYVRSQRFYVCKWPVDAIATPTETISSDAKLLLAKNAHGSVCLTKGDDAKSYDTLTFSITWDLPVTSTLDTTLPFLYKDVLRYYDKSPTENLRLYNIASRALERHTTNSLHPAVSSPTVLLSSSLIALEMSEPVVYYLRRYDPQPTWSQLILLSSKNIVTLSGELIFVLDDQNKLYSYDMTKSKMPIYQRLPFLRDIPINDVRLIASDTHVAVVHMPHESSKSVTFQIWTSSIRNKECSNEWSLRQATFSSSVVVSPSSLVVVDMKGEELYFQHVDRTGATNISPLLKWDVMPYQSDHSIS